MAGWQYLWLVWIAWTIALLFTLFVALIEPTGALRHPGAVLTVAEPASFVLALADLRDTASLRRR